MSTIENDEQAGWRNAELMLLGALLLGVAYERLLYDRPLGVAYPIWITLSLVVLILVARRQGVSSSRWTWPLLAAVVVLAGSVALRAEPLTVFLGVVLSLGAMGILLRALRPGGVLRWGWLDFGAALLWVPLEAWLRPWPSLGQVQARLTMGGGARRRLAGLMRGSLLALPPLVVFVVLFSAADPVFADGVERALAWLDLERVIELIGRATMIALVALFSLGALALALRRSPTAGPILAGHESKLPQLGMTEALVVLGSVNLLFAAFVAVQVRYFFAGEAAIGVDGYTYAEYARRGFGELVTVGLLTLGLVALLAVWVRSREGRPWRVYQGLGALLVGLTGVILVSALQRLLLYEQAYGFTRLRTYAHVAIIWMAVGFAVFLLLLLSSRLNLLAPALAAGCVGFTVTLALLNVDAFIVQQNFAYRQQIGELDVGYLRTLSQDAVPALAEHADDLEGAPRAELLADLVCRREQLARRWERGGWPALRWADARAGRALAALEPILESYELSRDGGSLQVQLPDGEHVACWRVGF